MSAGAIAGLSGGGAGASSAGRFGEMSSEDFVKVLTSELKNQDPMDPKDSGALLEQLSNLRNIESQMSLQKSLKSLVMQNQVASAGNMIGKMVAGIDDANDQVSGLVTSVRVEDERVLLELDSGKRLALNRVTQIDEGPSLTQGGV